MTENRLVRQRKKKLKELREQGIEPYAYRYDRTHYSQQIIGGYSKFKGKDVGVAGRIMSMRKMGKVTFMNLQDSKGRHRAHVPKSRPFQENDRPR